MSYDPRDFWMGSETVDKAKKEIDKKLPPDNSVVDEVYKTMRESMSLVVSFAKSLAEADGLTSQQRWRVLTELREVVRGATLSAGAVYFESDLPLDSFGRTGSPTDLATDRANLERFPDKFLPNA